MKFFLERQRIPTHTTWVKGGLIKISKYLTCLFIATTLFNLGIELKTIQVVGDDVQEITKSVRELSYNYDLVFTSGGIGTKR